MPGKCHGADTDPSGWLPDPKSDAGIHHFTYSILPHRGGWEEGKCIQHAGFLNNPVRVAIMKAPRPIAGGSQEVSLISLEQDILQVATIEAAEDGEGLVVRLINPTGGQSAPMCSAALT